MPLPALDRNRADLVLIVDDVPENLSVLHDALDEAGFTVLVALNGESALARARQSLPDAILLDAMMPGMDGYEVARRLKADFSTRHIPIIFMTGLTETEHVVAAFEAGGSDYVTKPVRTGEVLARLNTHLAAARQMRAARSALDAYGQATLALQPESGRITWQTPLARQLLGEHFPRETAIEQAPEALQQWLAHTRAGLRDAPEATPLPLSLACPGGKLVFSLHEQTPEGEWLLVLRQESEAAHLDALLAAFPLTRREAEVLLWATRGKTGPEIADILGASPRTISKHLEHVYEKLGVDNRTAAAKLALERLRA